MYTPLLPVKCLLNIQLFFCCFFFQQIFCVGRTIRCWCQKLLNKKFYVRRIIGLCVKQDFEQKPVNFFGNFVISYHYMEFLKDGQIIRNCMPLFSSLWWICVVSEMILYKDEHMYLTVPVPVCTHTPKLCPIPNKNDLDPVRHSRVTLCSMVGREWFKALGWLAS